MMCRLDKFVEELSNIYRLTGKTDIDKLYSVPKSYVNYHTPRRISEEQRERAREVMIKINLATAISEDCYCRFITFGHCQREYIGQYP